MCAVEIFTIIMITLTTFWGLITWLLIGFVAYNKNHLKEKSLLHFKLSLPQKHYFQQGCQHYRFFHRSTEFRKWSVFLQIFIWSFKIFGFFTDFAIFWFFSTSFIVIGNHNSLWPWSSCTANSDKKYMELNGAALNVNKSCATFRKTAFLKDK